MTRIYVDKSDVDKTVANINHQQSQAGVFINIAVKPYMGKKYDPARTAVIVVG